MAKNKKVVKRAEPKNGTVAVDYPEGSIEAYCMKCKAKVPVDGPKPVAISGRNAIQGKCSQCGTKVFKFVGKGGEKEVAAKSKAPVKPEGLSSVASRAYNKLEKAGTLDDCWVGTTQSGKAIWWEGNAEDGWVIKHDPIPDTEMPEFKKLVLKSL